MISTCPQAQKAGYKIKDHASSWLGRKTMRRKTWRLAMRERRSLNRSRTSVVRRFTEIMKDARARDWKNMAHFSNLRHSVYVFDHESKSVRNPGTEIEWPIVWLFSAFHRKHIFVPQKIPETKHINNVAIRLKRRVEWPRALRKDSTCLPNIHIKSREIASCSKAIPPIAKCRTAGLGNAIQNAARKGTNNRFTNETLLLRRARRRLRTTVQSDEDGGFVMCATHDIPQIHAKLPTKDIHDERHRHEYDTQCVIKCCSDFAKKIDKYEDEVALTRNHEIVVEQKLYSGVKVENHTNLLVKSHSERARKCGLLADWSGTLGGYKN